MKKNRYGSILMTFLLLVISFTFWQNIPVSASDKLNPVPQEPFAELVSIDVDLEQLNEGNIIYSETIDTIAYNAPDQNASNSMNSITINEYVHVLVFLNVTYEGNGRFHVMVTAESQRPFFLMKGISANVQTSGSAGYSESSLYNENWIPIIRVSAGGSLYCSEFYSGSQFFKIDGRHWAINGSGANFTRVLRLNT